MPEDEGLYFSHKTELNGFIKQDTGIRRVILDMSSSGRYRGSLNHLGFTNSHLGSTNPH